MPYIKKEKRPKIIKDPTYIGDVGDLNFAYSMTYIALWAKEQSYKTIEFIAGIGWSQEFPRFIQEIDRVVIKRGFSSNEVKRAKLLAYNEFMRRVGNNYEDKKIDENGDIYGDVLFSMVPHVAVTVLNPNAKKRGRKKKNV